MEASPWGEFHHFNLRDELFWFGKPRLLLRLMQFISFQNAFEMATFLWSLWEVKEGSCFTKNNTFLVIRLTFGVVSQVWCSFVTFPLYVIVTQMGSRFKKSIISKNVRKSLHGWQRRVKARQGELPFTLFTTSTISSSSNVDSIDKMYTITSKYEDGSTSHQQASMESSESLQEDKLRHSLRSDTSDDIYYDEYDGINVIKDEPAISS